jgi:beta-lactam-binding protein with PASTA domain
MSDDARTSDDNGPLWADETDGRPEPGAQAAADAPLFGAVAEPEPSESVETLSAEEPDVPAPVDQTQEQPSVSVEPPAAWVPDETDLAPITQCADDTPLFGSPAEPAVEEPAPVEPPAESSPVQAEEPRSCDVTDPELVAVAAALAVDELPASGEDMLAPALDGFAPDPVDDIPAAPNAAPAITPLPPASEPIDMGPDRGVNWWLWLGIVAATVAVGAIGYFWWWSVARPITTPSLEGKLPAQATQALNDAGLRLGKVSETPTDSATVGTVISQKPAAGATLKPGAEVALVLAAAPEQARVPDVSGKKLDEAETTLAQARLRPYRVDSYSTNLASGYVISQLPSAGVELAPGAAVALAVSKGPAPGNVTVPNVGGLSEADAESIISSRKLRSEVYRSYTSSVAAGLVMTQTPTPGTLLGYDSVVQLLVSQGPGTALAIVPSTVGMTQSAAEKALKDKGLVPKVVKTIHPTVAKGKVISQMPLANSRTAKGATVGILVSKGNLTEGPVPAVSGLASEEASGSIRSAGFRPVMIEIPYATATAGAVFMQYPAPGSTYAMKFPVICLVARPPGM